MAKLRAPSSRMTAVAPRLRQAPKKAEPFYLSPAWRALKDQRKLDLDYFAALARAKPGERVILDHVDERRDGGADLDPRNTEWLTASEHNRKTARKRAERASRKR